jgi:hypothetical protein
MSAHKRPDKGLRELVLRLTSLAMQVPRDAADVCVQYAGYTNCIYMEIHLGGYERGRLAQTYTANLDFGDANQEVERLIQTLRDLFFKPDEDVSSALRAGGAR